jgi:hypothetical protein
MATELLDNLTLCLANIKIITKFYRGPKMDNY